MRIFLQTSVLLARIGLLVAAISFAIAIYAWLPFAKPAQWLLLPMQLVTMLVLFCVFVQLARHHLIVFTHLKFAFPKVPLSRTYWVTASVLLVYFVAMFVGALLYYPADAYVVGVPSLRVFASGWLFFSFLAAGCAQWVGLRLRAYKSAA